MTGWGTLPPGCQAATLDISAAYIPHHTRSTRPTELLMYSPEWSIWAIQHNQFLRRLYLDNGNLCVTVLRNSVKARKGFIGKKTSHWQAVGGCICWSRYGWPPVRLVRLTNSKGSGYHDQRNSNRVHHCICAPWAIKALGNLGHTSRSK